MAKKKPTRKKAAVNATYGSPTTRRITNTKRKRSSSEDEDDDNGKKVAPTVASASASASTATAASASATITKPRKRRKIYQKLQESCCYDYHDKDASCNLLIEKVDVKRAANIAPTATTVSSSENAASDDGSTTTGSQQKLKAEAKAKTKKKTTNKRGGRSATAEKLPFDYSNNNSINDNSINNIGKMNSTERIMWTSSFGATYAAKGCVPSNVCRKLGMITRTILLPPKTVAIKKTKSLPSSFLSETMEPKKSNPGASNKTIKPPTLAQARKEARKLYFNNNDDHEEDEEEEDDATGIIESMAKQIIIDWKIALLNRGKIIPNWNSNGELVATNDTNTYSIGTIRRMIQSKKWIPSLDANDNVKNLYHLRIPIDALTVLNALEIMAKPDPKFYGVPFIIAIPVMEPIKCIDNNNNFGHKCAWRLSISIFAHRLLFECMTAENLRTVMAALDVGDDNDGQQADNNNTVIVRPLVKSPTIGPIVFGKDPKIRVEVIDDNDDSEMMEDENETRTDDTLDAFSTEGFLKLIENQGVSGVDTIYTNKIEPILYGPGQQQEQRQNQRSRGRGRRRSRDDNSQECRLQVSLLPHQIHGVCWMYQMENLDNDDNINNNSNNNSSLGLNGLLWERRAFREGDTYYYSPALGQVRLTIGQQDVQQRKRCNKGGILADEMGLGKTVQAVALVVATLNDLRNQKINEDFMPNEDEDGCYHHATLVIVPPALIGQWMNEIKKIAGDNLVVQFLDYKEQKKNQQNEDGGEDDVGVVVLNPNADIVLTTYQALDGKNNGTTKKGGSNKRAKASSVSKILSTTIWGRIILDEMQEIRSWTTSISKQCEQLKSDRRWMLSGTPLWEGIQDFRGELCFIGLEPFAANNEDGYFDFAIANHWDARSKYGLDILRILSLVMLRRTKSMHIIETGMPLLGLKNLTLTFEPVPQDPSERALYCFLESVMHTTLIDKSDDSNNNNNNSSNNGKAKQILRKNQQNKLIFLRLLRELCVSPFLINGGVGCSSQLSTLNRLMKEYNRRRLDMVGARQNNSGDNNNNTGAYSCDEAIQFLSQVEDVARTNSEFVTDLRIGGGGGISRRNRATLIDPQEKLRKSKEQIAKSAIICDVTRSNRARARWHLALEGVTTGRLEDKSCYNDISNNILKLWEWRNNVASIGTTINTNGNGGNIFSRMINTLAPSSSRAVPEITNVPSLLSRGFRPTEKYFGLPTGNDEREQKLRVLYKRRPEFRWAHPFAYIFSNIPSQVEEEELLESFAHLVSSQRVKIHHLRESDDSKTWTAVIHLSNSEDYDRFDKEAKRVHGIDLNITQNLPCIEQEIAAAKVKRNEAKALRAVHPCTLNERNLAKAKAAYEKAKLGLCALTDKHHRPGQVLCSRAFGHFRGLTPHTSASLLENTTDLIESAKGKIARQISIINNEERTVNQLRNKLGVSGTIESLNTFESLQALKNGDDEKTVCPICLDSLGADDGADDDSNGKVLLTRCGHLTCHSCLQRWMDEKDQQRMAITCIECRKPIVRSQLICVDPKKIDKYSGDRQDKAKLLVQQAATMLKENFGQLEPHLWEALYLVIDLPSNIDRNLNPACSAIPGLFLGHLRHAMDGLPLHSAPSQMVTKRTNNYPSKLRALLADLPRDELSVVFASSKSIILHIQSVLEIEGIRCTTLFVGQSEKQSECAISDWECETNDALVLIVQAGAAACGLTLTAACKMFIMEPFRKHEEEKQAYARLHRFGQKHAVQCKVYYTPVSVESRLLEWRRLATTHVLEEEKTVYAPLRGNEVDDDDDDGSSDEESDGDSDDETAGEKDEDGGGDGDDDVVEEDAVEEENQTRFLLGLSTTTTTTEANNNSNQAAGTASTTTVTRRQIRTTNQRAGTSSDPILL